VFGNFAARLFTIILLFFFQCIDPSRFLHQIHTHIYSTPRHRGNLIPRSIAVEEKSIRSNEEKKKKHNNNAAFGKLETHYKQSYIKDK